ncbi:hypothetical protein COSO111634_34100 [Corallococcus soli]
MTSASASLFLSTSAVSSALRFAASQVTSFRFVMLSLSESVLIFADSMLSPQSRRKPSGCAPKMLMSPSFLNTHWMALMMPFQALANPLMM